MNARESFSNLTYINQLHMEEDELVAFVGAVSELFGAEQAKRSAEDWLGEAELMDAPPLSTERDWRAVTVAASARLASRINASRCQRRTLVATSDTRVLPTHSEFSAADV